MSRLRINEAYRKIMPSNCPVIEQTAEGVEVGVCTFHMPDGHTCPRHGDVNALAIFKDAETLAVKVCAQVEEAAKANRQMVLLSVKDMRELLHLLMLVQHRAEKKDVDSKDRLV